MTVKEALSTKARHLRRSLSTPNVHNVSTTAGSGACMICLRLGCDAWGGPGGNGVFGTAVGVPVCRACSSVIGKNIREHRLGCNEVLQMLDSRESESVRDTLRKFVAQIKKKSKKIEGNIYLKK